jgi:hypothetical protein
MSVSNHISEHKTVETSVLIVGGGTGGVAAALALASRGVRCVVTEPTDWVGGQLTSQAVPPDENRWIEGREGIQSATQSYLDYRNNVRDWYRLNRNLKSEARKNMFLNPGNGWVSRLCHEPVVGHAVLLQMLQPYLASKLITLLLDTEPVAVETANDRITSVTVKQIQTNSLTSIQADYVLDASELGDVLHLGKIEHHIGAEHRDVHDELHGRTDKTDDNDVQAISWCFGLEHCPGQNHTIDRPPEYDFWRNYIPPLTPPWPGRLLSWTVLGGNDQTPRTFRWLPWPSEPEPNEWEMWRYRRIVDTSIYEDHQSHPDVALINMVQMDYFLKSALVDSVAERNAIFAQARQLSLCFLYWMQTQAPRFDGSDATGFAGLKLRGNELGTTDGFAKYPYIREARRLDSIQVASEKHVGIQQRRSLGLIPREAPPWGSAECFTDSVGIGHYRLDLHPSSAMRNGIYVEAAPFRIPLGSLIPRRVTNLIAAGKCLGVTHITNGCYRLHPVEWNVGESAGHLAAYCILNSVIPRQVHDNQTHLRSLQADLVRSGIPLAWPWENNAGL